MNFKTRNNCIHSQNIIVKLAHKNKQTLKTKTIMSVRCYLVFQYTKFECQLCNSCFHLRVFLLKGAACLFNFSELHSKVVSITHRWFKKHMSYLQCATLILMLGSVLNCVLKKTKMDARNCKKVFKSSAMLVKSQSYVNTVN